MDEKEVLSYLMELFPTEGTVVPYIELRYRFVTKFSEESIEDFEDFLENLVDKGVLSKFEFNDNLNYKSQKEIPISMSGGSTPTPSTPQPTTSQTTISPTRLKRLSDLVVAVAETVDDDDVRKLLEEYKKDFS